LKAGIRNGGIRRQSDSRRTPSVITILENPEGAGEGKTSQTCPFSARLFVIIAKTALSMKMIGAFFEPERIRRCE
jgi:hypothetical protein